MFSLFEKAETRKAKNFLSQLVSMAKSDGQVHNDEMVYIYKIGERNGLKPNEIETIVNASSTAKLIVPGQIREKFELIYALTELMHADGVITEEELDLCVDYALKLGVKKEIAGVLVRKISMDVHENLNIEKIWDNVQPFIAKA